MDVRLDDSFHAELLAPARVEPIVDPVQAVRDALIRPVGDVRVADFAKARSVAIAISDKTRPVPHAILLPPLLQALEQLGIPPGAITLIVATGLHAPMPQAEFAVILPADLLARYRVISHDATATEELFSLGKTRLGTPVQANRVYAQADLRLVVGSLEPHQFMGFSDAVKTAAIGLGGRDTINQNHARMLDPRSDLARYEDNPARRDVEEIGRLMGIHFALDAIIIILVAACPEGTGSRSYEDWVTGMASHLAVLERFQREGFRIGPHKAFQIARDAGLRRVLMVTQMPPELLQKLLLNP